METKYCVGYQYMIENSIGQKLETLLLHEGFMYSLLQRILADLDRKGHLDTHINDRHQHCYNL